MKRNLRKLKELKKAYKNLTELRYEAWKTIRKSQVKINHLDFKIGKNRKIIQGINANAEALKEAIGKVKGIHCLARIRRRDCGDYYFCAVLDPEGENDLKDVYLDYCYSCRLSEDSICTRVVMWKLGKR